MSLYRCSLCVEFIAHNLNILLSHIARIHKSDPNFHVLCGIDGCPKTYTNFVSFRNHLIRKHSITRNLTARNGEIGPLPNAEREPDEFEEGNENLNDLDDVDNGLEFNLAREEAEIRKTSALCLLQFKEKGRVPQTVVDLLVETTTQTVRTSINVLKSGIVNKFHAAGIDFEAVAVYIDFEAV